MTRREKLLMAVISFAHALLWNYRFIYWCSPQQELKMNDVVPILKGFYQTPNLLTGGLKWWTGTWIYDGIHAYRPVASYLYWIVAWIGTNYGYIWSAWLAFFLYLSVCWIMTALAWRFTASKWCAWLALMMATSFRSFNFAGTQG